MTPGPLAATIWPSSRIPGAVPDPLEKTFGAPPVNQRIPLRPLALFPALLILLLAAAAPATARAADSGKIDYTEETLPNGLRVIYAPLHQAPVVELQIFYHVGSRDERPDRQGFAHMFEHMMFRGSAHVKPQEHMRVLGAVGGMVNAYTSYDQTVYHETLPASALETALYLEADRMASFKVSDDIFATERKVVAEEWRMRYMNQPYGRLFEDFQKAAFTTHSYRWTPIGNMDQLRASRVNELQDFFNTYYLPNNAVMIVAGDIDPAAAKQLVHRYFAWIPRGPEVPREIPKEPEQTEPRHIDVAYRAPLPAIRIGYQIPAYRSEDHDALGLLGDILGDGRSSRLQKLLVSGASPKAVQVLAGEMRLEDGGLFMVGAMVMQGKDPAAVEKTLLDAVAEVAAKGVTAEELEKVKTLERVALVRGRETATSISAQLGGEALLTGDPSRVNTELARMEAVTPADIQRVAAKYLQPNRSTTIRVKPDPLGKDTRIAAATQAAMDVPVVPASKPVTPRPIAFPADWPATAPVPQLTTKAHFEKGTETMVDGVRVIVMPDARLPLVSWSLTTRHGDYEDPKGKEGLSGLSDAMLRRGAGDMSYDALAQDLESHGISIEVGDGGDNTRLAGSCATPELGHALERSKQIFRSPTFPEAEFTKLKEQTVNELRLSQENPSAVAGNDLAAAVWGDSPLGRVATPATVESITLDEVKQAYARNFTREGAVLVFSGDVTVEQGEQLAKSLLEGWSEKGAPAPELHLAGNTPAKLHIIVVDRPSGRQATVRMAIPAYDIRADEKFAGSVAGQVLSGGGIDSRLMRYVRAEKGLCYGVSGTFQPARHGGTFSATTDTAVESTADAVEAIFKVFNDLRTTDVTPEEMAMAKTRVAGAMLMGMQTIQQQAGYRVDGILNNYPIDYFDNYPAKIAAVTNEQVREIANKYIHDGQMTIVVVAPAEQVKEQLKRLGEVEVIPMPAKREGGQGKPQELLKPAA
jgi:zinc protease